MPPKKGAKVGNKGGPASPRPAVEILPPPPRPSSLLRASVAARTVLPINPTSVELQNYIESFGEVPAARFGDVDDRDIPDMVSMTIPSLLENWNDYRPRLEVNINELRDDKLKSYAGSTMQARRDVDLSQSRVNIWRRVFEERYGLSGDPESSSEAFLSHGVEKLIPDDIDNVNRYMRFRALFLILYNEAVKRKSKVLEDETPDIDVGGGQYQSLQSVVDTLAPSPEEVDDENEVNVILEVKKSGGSSRSAGAVPKRRGKKTQLTDTQVERLQAELEDYKQKFRYNIPSCSDPKSSVTQEQCLRRERDFLLQEYREQKDARETIEENLAALRDRRKALLGTQRWLTSSWKNLEVLPSAQQAVASLHLILRKSQSTMVGREEIMNRLASMIHTFSYNHRAFTQTYLNFALLGMPGTGKTTIAQTIADILRNLGILVTSKFSTIGREDMVGQYLGETALKTKALLTNHIEGVLFLDEAYSLGTRDSSGKPDVYGAEALNTLTNFTDKWRGQLVFIAAGYEDDMNKDFFGVNKGLERRFSRLPLDKFAPNQLLTIFLQKVLKKIHKESDRKIFTNSDALRYTLSSLKLLNSRCVGTRRTVDCLLPNQGGDIETLADVAVQYFYNVVRPRKDADFTACDMRNILQRFLFQTQRAHIVIDDADTKGSCDTLTPVTQMVGSKGSKKKRLVILPSQQQCDAGGKGCLRLTNPNTQLIAALKYGSFPNAASSTSSEEVSRNAFARPTSRPASRHGGFDRHPPPLVFYPRLRRPRPLYYWRPPALVT